MVLIFSKWQLIMTIASLKHDRLEGRSRFGSLSNTLPNDKYSELLLLWASNARIFAVQADRSRFTSCDWYRWEIIGSPDSPGRLSKGWSSENIFLKVRTLFPCFCLKNSHRYRITGLIRRVVRPIPATCSNGHYNEVLISIVMVYWFEFGVVEVRRGWLRLLVWCLESSCGRSQTRCKTSSKRDNHKSSDN